MFHHITNNFLTIYEENIQTFVQFKIFDIDFPLFLKE